MKKITGVIKLVVIGLVLAAVFISPISVMAQETTASPSATETTQKLRERIERIVSEKRDQIAGAIDQLIQHKKGLIGQVDRVTAEAVTISNAKGTQIIPVNNDVTLLKGGDSIDIDQVAVGDWLVVMGVIEDDAFLPLRILVSSSSLRPRSHLVAIGTVTDISPSQLDVRTRQEEELSFTLNSRTQIQDRDGSQLESTDIESETQVLIVGYDDDEDGKIATTVRSLAQISN